MRPSAGVFGGYCKFYQGLKDALLEFAENEIRLSAPQSDKRPLREHLECAWQQTGIRPAELIDCKCPDAILHVWRWFLELNEARGSGGMGASAISYQDILSWSITTNSEPTPFEVSCIRALDSLMLKVSA